MNPITYEQREAMTELSRCIDAQIEVGEIFGELRGYIDTIKDILIDHGKYIYKDDDYCLVMIREKLMEYLPVHLTEGLK